jgi:hypothetical protein
VIKLRDARDGKRLAVRRGGESFFRSVWMLLWRVGVGVGGLIRGVLRVPAGAIGWGLEQLVCRVRHQQQQLCLSVCLFVCLSNQPN